MARLEASMLRSSEVKGKAVKGKASHARIEAVAGVLADYARRGVFRGFSRCGIARRGAAFRIAWHWNRELDLVFDFQRCALRCHNLLSNVPGNSALCRQLRDFVRSRHGENLPEHRRIDRHKAQVDVFNRGGNVSLVLRVKQDECEYGTRKLIHLLQELFMTFLTDGAFFDHVVEVFDLDPDVL